jgi:hypothetical protein
MESPIPTPIDPRALAALQAVYEAFMAIETTMPPGSEARRKLQHAMHALRNADQHIWPAQQ